MFSTKEEVRISAAELYALVIVATSHNVQQFDVINELVDNLLKQVSSAKFL